MADAAARRDLQLLEMISRSKKECQKMRQQLDMCAPLLYNLIAESIDSRAFGGILEESADEWTTFRRQ